MKNLLVINGIPEGKSYEPFEAEIEECISRLEDTETEYFVLRKMKINYCTGCWNCWVKTPGVCVIRDDQEKILQKYPGADNVLYISPVIAGYESSLLKTCKDRSIPLIHPYISIYKGEQHHRPRYRHMPDINLLLLTDKSTEDEDLEIMKETYDRIALNFRVRFNSFAAAGDREGVESVFNSL